METMTLDEFNRKYKNRSGYWNWDKFKIVCQKCCSDKVEFNSDIDCYEEPYYGGIELEGGIIVKCHECGNAIKIYIDSLNN